MATLKEAIQEAVRVGDAQRAARIAGRFATYRDALAFAQDCCPGLTAPQWDALMYEADRAEDD